MSDVGITPPPPAEPSTSGDVVFVVGLVSFIGALGAIVTILDTERKLQAFTTYETQVKDTYGLPPET